MSLLRENVYISLIGKSEDELTKLYWLLANNSEVLYRSFKRFLEYPSDGEPYIGFCESSNYWWSGIDLGNRKEVTIEQLKEILKPMENKEEQLIKEAKERGFLTEGNEFYSCFSDKNKLRIIKPYNSELEINLYLDKIGYLRYDDGLNNKYDESLCSNPAIYKDGVWAEIKNHNLTLTEQLQKAEAEVKRLKEAIEDSKIKEGEWCRFWNYDKSDFIIAKFQGKNKFACTSGNYFFNCEKITDSVLLENLNKMF